MVDYVVVSEAENHWQTFGEQYNPAYAGKVKVPVESLPPMEMGPRKIIARRAAFELQAGDIVNLGIGMPEGVSAVAAEEKILKYVTLTAEPGVVGLLVIVLATAFCGVTEEHRIGHAFEEALPFTALLVVFFTYFYTAIQFDPERQAETIQRQGGFIPGIRPGKKTAEYIDRILTRVTLPGAFYLAVIALVPFWIFDIFSIQTFFFGGTSLLIVVGVALDTVQQAQQHLMLRHYDGFMKKGRVKMRGRQRYM